MVDELLGNIISELRKRVTFGGFSEDMMQSLLEGMWNKVEYALKDSQKFTGQLEYCSDSKVMQIFLIEIFLNIILGEVGFICFLNPINFLTAFV